ncbi:MAG TPA: hypothetical protein VKE40_10800 [Gemmataceae bacterium]|nr:hypothetical protein [Gemmataceae bacterium]
MTPRKPRRLGLQLATAGLIIAGLTGVSFACLEKIHDTRDRIQ